MVVASTENQTRSVAAERRLGELEEKKKRRASREPGIVSGRPGLSIGGTEFSVFEDAERGQVASLEKG